MMIKNGVIHPNPPGTYCCAAGRPLRAKEMRGVFTSIGLRRHHNPRPDGANCYIYCERNSDHQGHVYYGTRTSAVPPTHTWDGADYYEYYF
jgi:hypothetical protein